MKHQKTILYLGALGVLLGLMASLQSCLKGCELPDLEAYHYGLLDSMPEGTQVVFESNTGKLDTATYGPIVKKVNRADNTRARCEQQFTNVHYEEQKLTFKNKFGWQNLYFIRRSKYNIDNDDDDNAIFLWYNLDTFSLPFDNQIYWKFNEKYQTNFDIDSNIITDRSDKYKGNVLLSKKRGIVKCSFPYATNNDTLFYLKKIIK